MKHVLFIGLDLFFGVYQSFSQQNTNQFNISGTLIKEEREELINGATIRVYDDTQIFNAVSGAQGIFNLDLGDLGLDRFPITI